MKIQWQLNGMIESIKSFSFFQTRVIEHVCYKCSSRKWKKIVIGGRAISRSRKVSKTISCQVEELSLDRNALKSSTVKGTDASRWLVIMVGLCGSSLLFVSILSESKVISQELGFKRKHQKFEERRKSRKYFSGTVGE